MPRRAGPWHIWACHPNDPNLGDYPVDVDLKNRSYADDLCDALNRRARNGTIFVVAHDGDAPEVA